MHLMVCDTTVAQVFHVTGFDWQSRALKLYASQLALNFLWPIVSAASPLVPNAAASHLCSQHAY